MKKLIHYFSFHEVLLWCLSAFVIIVSFCLFDRTNYVSLVASIIGVTSLIFCAKGNPIGQVLMIIFSIIYAVISLSFSYYGELITYLFMTLPMSLLSLISWLRNPYKGNKAEVKVNSSISNIERVFMWILTLVVTVAFFFILKLLGTSNLIPSTFSISTSFLAAYLTFRRSPFFALAYAVNDIVLIVLWILASIANIHYVSVVVCFIAFLFNDLNVFTSWLKMKKRQSDD